MLSVSGKSILTKHLFFNTFSELSRII